MGFLPDGARDYCYRRRTYADRTETQLDDGNSTRFAGTRRAENSETAELRGVDGGF